MGDRLKLAEGGFARRALELSESEPTRALALLEVDSRDQSGRLDGHDEASPAAQGIVSLARGLACQRLGQREAALAALRDADRLLTGNRLRIEASRARVALAFESLNDGDVAEALRLLSDADKGLRGPAAARVAMQRALVLQRAGRDADTIEEWTKAIRSFKRAGSLANAARAQGNRGIVRVYRGEFKAAGADLGAAENIFRRIGDGIGVAEAIHNQAFLSIRRGDLPTALRLFDEAQQRYGRLGASRPEILLDRAETLLAAGVASEARAVCEAAIAALQDAGRATDCAEAMLLAGQVCEECGDGRAAAEWARKAQTLFREQCRPKWELLATFRALKLTPPEGASSAEHAELLGAIAHDLRSAGWTAAAVEADALAVELFCDSGRPDLAHEGSARLARARRNMPPAYRLTSWVAEARLRLCTGDNSRVEAALHAALRAAQHHQAGLGSVELRTRLAGRAAGIAAVGLRAAAQYHRPERGLYWAEAARAIEASWPQTPNDPEARSAIEALREVTARLEGEDLDPPRRLRLGRQQAALEEVVRRQSRYVEGPGSEQIPRPSVTEILHTVEARLLIEYAADGEDLMAVTVHRQQVRLHKLGEVASIRRDVAGLRLAILSTLNSSGPASARQLTAAARTVERQLISPICDDLDEPRNIVIVPTGVVASVPWGILPGLREADIVVAPSATDWVRGYNSWRPLAPPIKALTIAGPGLDNAESEARDVAGIWRNATVLAGTDAAVVNVLRSIGHADVVHVAAHGRFRTDNPLLTSIHLVDGPLTLAELTQIRPLPRLVVFSSCNTGMSDADAAGPFGMSSLLQRAGVLTVIASVTPVHDDESPALMTHLHSLLADGTDPATAVRQMHARAGLPNRSRGFIAYTSR